MNKTYDVAYQHIPSACQECECIPVHGPTPECDVWASCRGNVPHNLDYTVTLHGNATYDNSSTQQGVDS